MQFTVFAAAIPTIILSAMLVQASDAPTTLRQIEPLLEDGTVAVIRLNLEQITDEHLKLLISPQSVSSPDQYPLVLGYSHQICDRIRKSGVTFMYGVVSSYDLGQFGPTWLIPVDDKSSADQLARRLYFNDGESPDDPEVASVGRGLRIAVRDDVVWLGPSVAHSRLGKVSCPSRPSLLPAFSAVEGQPFVVVFSPTDSQRRVIREFWPGFPASATSLTGEQVAAIDWASVSVNSSGEQLDAKISCLEAVDLDGLAAGLTQLMAWVGQNTPPSPEVKPVAAYGLTVEGRHIVGSSPISGSTAGHLVQQLCKGGFLVVSYTGAVQAAEQAGIYPYQSMTALKQLGLAMHNFHDTWKSFPPSASYSKDGQPLLSWRVFLLPYLGLGDLYKQFRLDEPWDSPHNKTLISQMPAVYAGDAVDLNRLGKTTYMLPLGEGTVFHGREGTPMQSITDGTSNTFMVIQTAPEQAVIWTKPEDLTVDFQHLDRLFPASMSTFRATLCDGSAWSNLNPRMPAETLKRLLQKADGEQIDTNSTRK